MRHAIAIAVSITASTFAAHLSAQGHDDGKAIKGEWQCTRRVYEGKDAKKSTVKGIMLKLDGKRLKEVSLGEVVAEFDYAILPGGVIRLQLVGETTYMLGRYELKGKTLKLCYPGPLEVGKEPGVPERFESPKGSIMTLSEWVRRDLGIKIGRNPSSSLRSRLFFSALREVEWAIST